MPKGIDLAKPVSWGFAALWLQWCYLHLNAFALRSFATPPLGEAHASHENIYITSNTQKTEFELI